MPWQIHVFNEGSFFVIIKMVILSLIQIFIKFTHAKISFVSITLLLN